jgi:hypothetical protein
LIVIDVDGYKGGEESLEEIFHRFGRLDTLEVIRGSGQGRHYYFSKRANISIGCHTELWPGVDVRGQGGYVVAPPSRHRSGNQYGFDGIVGANASISPVPQFLLDLIAKRRQEVQVGSCNVVLNPFADPPNDRFFPLMSSSETFRQSWERQRTDLHDSSASAYDLSLASIAYSHGWSDQEIVDLLVASRRRHGDPKLREDYYARTLRKAKNVNIQAEKEDRNVVDIETIKRKWGILRPSELREKCRVAAKCEYIIKDLIPRQSLVLGVGDSGLGKTPLLYQLGMSVAAGVPFLGMPTQQGPVLYLDFENGLDQVNEMNHRLASHLGLASPPEEFFVWNFNDTAEIFSEQEDSVLKMIEEFRPSLAIIDPLSAPFPRIDEKNSDVNATYRKLRQVMRSVGCSIMPVHHLKKPSGKADEVQPSLEDGDVRSFFLQARGPRSLVTGVDRRLGFDKPSLQGHLADERLEIALVMGGFGRISGDLPIVHLGRCLDDDGDPIGYKRLEGVELLGNADQKDAFEKLPSSFRHKEAKHIYRKGGQATTDFLRKCEGAGLIAKVGKLYVKIAGLNGPSSKAA